MLLRNLNPAAGLCNGTRLIVRRMEQRLLICEIITGHHKGDIVAIPKIICTTEEGRFPFKLYRKQFPVRVCFAMTINKSQGQTIDFVGLDLEHEIWTHGQLYVAFSRVRSWDNIVVKLSADAEGRTRNVVWDEALNP